MLAIIEAVLVRVRHPSADAAWLFVRADLVLLQPLPLLCAGAPSQCVLVPFADVALPSEDPRVADQIIWIPHGRLGSLVRWLAAKKPNRSKCMQKLLFAR